ncbi:hypothetical protein J7I94_26575 [Streptomyces sp. ISL-12]|uniref:hypothetical protein n=1 Tax=Streptomyces sp. ISL-12 TaxID=2819177 RepID=UPI001BE6A35D|nr:hypothetical protein [Streptomyces sp. ISL-12]MBT2414068.1 hypothetical protein [Streptomyces sp. ISL-12]
MWRSTTGRRESRRVRQREAVRLLRAQGRHGPEFREVLPALTGLVLVLCAGVAGLAAGYRSLGVVVPLAFLALLAVVVPVVVGRLRPPARRRRGRYTAEEIAALDTEGLALAVTRMLRRDGWSVRPPSGERVRPRVRARHPRGHRLEVAFRPVAEPLPDEDPPVSPSRRADAGPPVLLIVHRGTFSARDARWARHRTGTRLMDGALLRRWADGTSLDRLIDLT